MNVINKILWRIRYLKAHLSHKLKLYTYKPERYRGSFTNDPIRLEKSLVKRDFKKRVYCFWTGDNKMSENRLSCLQSMHQNIGVEVILITPTNLSEFILPEYPLHEAYEYLSLVHKSDYLRCYFMHHYGGGYADIKMYNKSWIEAFRKVTSDNEAFVLGYQEVGEYGVPKIPGLIGRDIKKYFPYLLGNGAFIYKSNTPLTMQWYSELHKRLDNNLLRLKERPGNILDANSGYPLKWSYLLGEILHPLLLKYHKHILQCDDVKPSFKNYR
ncbi:capsular polysaccharide synthesis protein [Pseudoalteromonas sp. 2CM36K]|uniref:capsular polysaccharide synthesis protein n=1 Tax=Pseudoalteromonas sp. 2CM36K TaxID=2929854 RepID=UPI0020BE47D1|nr:capsular polysaccharide synthesis protein [Pseudoalteromonas sp. 2CM36K]MCK8104708.1 capsular polysaccharide synthesis protein [Pseudoalteromonas sp. 2CM36K]